MQTKIEELLGYNNNKSPGSETIRRAYYITAASEIIARNEFHSNCKRHRRNSSAENSHFTQIAITGTAGRSSIFGRRRRIWCRPKVI